MPIEVYIGLFQVLAALAPGLSEQEWQQVIREASRDACNSDTKSRRGKRHAPPDRAGKIVSWYLLRSYEVYGWMMLRVAARLRAEPRSTIRYLANLTASGIVPSPDESEGFLQRLGEKIASLGRSPNYLSFLWLAGAMLSTLLALTHQQVLDFFGSISDDFFARNPGGKLLGNLKLGSYRKSYSSFQRLFASRMGWPAPVAEQGLPTVFPKLREVAAADPRSAAFWRLASAICPLFLKPGHVNEPGRQSIYWFHQVLFHQLICQECLRRRAQHIQVGWKGVIRLPQDHETPPPDGGEVRDFHSLAEQTRDLCDADEKTRNNAQGRIQISIDDQAPEDLRPGQLYNGNFSVEIFVGTVSMLWHELRGPGYLTHPVRARYRVGQHEFTIRQNQDGVRIAARLVPEREGNLLRQLVYGAAAAAVIALTLFVSFPIPTISAKQRMAETKDVLSPARPTTIIEVDLGRRVPFLHKEKTTLELIKGAQILVCPLAPGARGSILAFDCARVWGQLANGQPEYRVLLHWGWFSRYTERKPADFER